MTSKGPRTVMIFAVDVIRDSPPDSDCGCSRDNRVTTRGHRQPQDICQQDTGFASDTARVAVEGDEAIQGSRQQQRAAGFRQLSP